MVLFPLDFSKQRDFMPQLAALCEQFVLDIPETQRVIYIASCNSFFFSRAKAALDFTSHCLPTTPPNKQSLKARGTLQGRKISQLLLELEAKHRYHAHRCLALKNLLGICDAAPKFWLLGDRVDGQNSSVFPHEIF